MTKCVPLENPFRAKTGKSFSLPGFGFVTPLPEGQRQEPPPSNDNSTTLAAMLTAAVVAAALVVADQVMSTWADGQLLIGWVGLWLATFAVLFYMAPSLRQMTAVIADTVQHWEERRALQRADERLWSLAMQDHRLLDELRVAQMRGQGRDE